jgi:uncharacterized protein YqiB (DUF1249 family)
LVLAANPAPEADAEKEKGVTTMAESFELNTVEVFPQTPDVDADRTEHSIGRFDASVAQLRLQRDAMVRDRDRLNFLIAQADTYLNTIGKVS